MTPDEFRAFLSQHEGGVSVDEGLALQRYAADCAGGDIVKIGSFRSSSTAALAEGANHLRVQVSCVDPQLGRPKNTDASDYVMQQTMLLEKVALINLPSRNVARAWPRPIELLLIGGDHSSRSVMADVEAWDPHLCIGGVVAFNEVTDPVIGALKLLEQILATGRYIALETIGKVHFLRKISTTTFQRPGKKRILVVIPGLYAVGGLLRFERFGRIARTRSHEMAYLQLLEPSASSIVGSFASDFPVLDLEEALHTEWDVTMVPGALAAPTVLEILGQLVRSQFGLRIQHVLNDQTRKEGFLQVNRLFAPHVVVFNNQGWPPGSYTTFRARRFHVIEGGVDLAAFAPQRFFKRKRRGAPFVVGGQGQARKNPIPLIESIHELGEGFELRLFGDPGNLPETAEDLLRSGALKLLGPVSEQDLPAFYNDLDCVVHAETFAGWANMGAEALASGVPLICTRPGTGAFAFHGETALILSEPTKEEICSSIKQLQSNEDLQRRLSVNGRRIIGRFSWEAYATTLLDLMDNPDQSVHYTWAPEANLYGKWPLEARLQGLDAILKTSSGQNVLDLGTADGLVARAFLEHGAANMHGVDLDPTRVTRSRAICSAFPAAQFWVADLSDWDGFVRSLGARSNIPYDTVLSLGIHHHLPPERRQMCLLGAAALARTNLLIRTSASLFQEDRIMELLTDEGFTLESVTNTALDIEIGTLHWYRRAAQ